MSRAERITHEVRELEQVMRDQDTIREALCLNLLCWVLFRSSVSKDK